MNIVLDTWERIQLLQVISGGRGTIGQVELGLQALTVLRLSDEEKRAVGWIELGPNQLAWTQGAEHDLEFAGDVWQLVQGLTAAYQSWPMDERVVALRGKILGDE